MKLACGLLAAACVLDASVVAVQTREVFQAGNGVSRPTVVKQVKADYTPEAKAARIEGTVLLNVVVLADGAIGEVTVARSLDRTLGLDRQAVNAMKQWEFKPGTKDGKPVPVRINVEMTFMLK